MASKPLNSSSFVSQSILSFLNTLTSDQTIYVGYSGGLDSSVVLHALHRAINQGGFANQLVAIHVNHGLQAEADGWSKHCSAYCQLLAIDFMPLKVEVKPAQRQGLEAEARAQRYQAFAKAIQSNNKEKLEQKQSPAILVTAHHQRDQAETLLLNLFRGAGIQGLAAMPYSKVLNEAAALDVAVRHCRPLLEVPYQALLHYAKQYQVDYIEDPSNQDSEFKRNLVRNEVLPSLGVHWNGLEQKLADSAGYMQESLELLDELAKLHLSETEYSFDYISVPECSIVQKKNLIRFWFKRFWPNVTLSATHFNWVLDALENYENSQNKSFSKQLKIGELRVYKRRLYYLVGSINPFQFSFSNLEALVSFINQSPSVFSVGARSKEESFVFKINKKESGLNIVLRPIQPSDSVNKKQLKAFFQKAGIPFWLRAFWPVLEFGEREQVVILGCPKCSGALQTDETFVEVALNYSQLRQLQS